ncbi:hypothetical protein CAPTEDRAFT_215640 [Capitella teleta]|uniref:G-protein coupled receptors family 1 profile domain-containing protein n=1 Tax=Capitella teleta TaxID=283909 RepID=R7T617_CAPTE|nr:hypothetical protein CAPTEDRAFT_215640 [Capitella teleta]|eukprot:ELT88934.1 hypothetical protein CAPTEDRAFT_215640 [Capitella teleta]
METTTEEMPQEETANVKLAILLHYRRQFTHLGCHGNAETHPQEFNQHIHRQFVLVRFPFGPLDNSISAATSVAAVERYRPNIHRNHLSSCSSHGHLFLCVQCEHIPRWRGSCLRNIGSALLQKPNDDKENTHRIGRHLVSSVLTITACAIITVQINSGFEMLTYSYELLPEKFISYFSTPMLIISIATNAILYAVIIIAFCKSTKKIQPSSTSELRNRRMTRMITMVIGLLLLGNIPIITVATQSRNIGSQSEYFNSLKMFDDIALLLMIIPTSLNNCIYVWQLPDFKNALMKLLFCHWNTRVEPTIK